MTTNAAQSAINARIDSLLESMPPVARQRQSDDLDVTVPLWAVRSVMDEVETLRGALRAVTDWLDVPIDSAGGGFQLGRASCRERGCQYVKVSVVAGSLK